MRIVLFAALLAGCVEPGDGGGDPLPGDGGDVDTDTDTDTEDEFDPYEIGRTLPSFVLEDINPTSATFGQMVDSADLAGKPYGMIFLDSRCVGCHDVAVDIWAEYVGHDGWWEALPTFAIQSPAGMESEVTTAEMVVDHDLPYLADTWEQELWAGYGALNHDFFVVTAEGTLDAWLPLYVWPESLPDFLSYMEERLSG